MIYVSQKVAFSVFFYETEIEGGELNEN